MAKGILRELHDINSLKSRRKSTVLIFFCFLTGIVTGGVVASYRLLLDKIAYFRHDFFKDMSLGRVIIGMSIFILIGIAVQFMLSKYPMISGSGIPQVNGLLQKKVGFNWFPELICKFVGGVLAIGTGMSLGREGPSIHLGALIGDGINKLSKRASVEEKYLVTCGASAGLSAAFNAPLAGAIFALEELHKFFSPLLLICVLVASGAANYVSRTILKTGITFQHNFVLPDGTSPLFAIVTTVIFCVIMAVSGKAFGYFLVYFQKKYKGVKLNKYLKISCFMIIAYLTAVFFREVTGGGHDLIENMFQADVPLKILFVILILKFFYSMLSYSTGFPGGIFLPMLVIGALVGKVYGVILVNYFSASNEFIVHFMLLGMAAYFTAVVKAPITGIILILEMTGNFSYLFLLTITATITYILTEMMKMEPIYEVLFENMFAKSETEKKGSHSPGKENKIVTLLIHVGADSELENKKIKDLNLPKKLLIMSVRANGKEYIPDGETVVRSGNQLVIVTDYKTAQKYAYDLKDKGIKIL